jgi:hypothetical protein
MCVRFMLSTLAGLQQRLHFAQGKHAILLPLVAKELTRIFGTALHFDCQPLHSGPI